MFAFFVVYLYFGPAAAPGTRGSRRDVLSPRVCVKGCEMYKTKTMDKYGTKPKNTVKSSWILAGSSLRGNSSGRQGALPVELGFWTGF
jgi:hypothetical protein